jgi:hypothetical protein
MLQQHKCNGATVSQQHCADRRANLEVSRQLSVATPALLHCADGNNTDAASGCDANANLVAERLGSWLASLLLTATHCYSLLLTAALWFSSTYTAQPMRLLSQRGTKAANRPSRASSC